MGTQRKMRRAAKKQAGSDLGKYRLTREGIVMLAAWACEVDRSELHPADRAMLEEFDRDLNLSRAGLALLGVSTKCCNTAQELRAAALSQKPELRVVADGVMQAV